MSEDNTIQFENLLTGNYFFSITYAGGCSPSSLLGVPTSESLFTFIVNQVQNMSKYFKLFVHLLHMRLRI